ncbi:MAG: hypothetical protein FWD47_03315 [Treponema sp.]|nr:hypothetical protein [Treponema sp.]
MEKWWLDNNGFEPDYIAIIKIVPQITYEIIYETLIKQEVIYETVYETIFETIFVQLPPATIVEYVYSDLPPGIIYRIIYELEIIHETVYETVYEIIEKEVFITLPPTKEEIIEYIENNREVIIEIIRDNPVIREEIINEIIKYLTKEQIIEIIKEIPPELIYEYLTEEQIIEIIKLQPPQIIMQNINIINIDYILFAGDSDELNGPPIPPAVTPLTNQEKIYNLSAIDAAAKTLAENPNYLVMLHGHANPSNFSEGELSEIIVLSINRANSVEEQLKTDFLKYSSTTLESNRLSSNGYGGGKNLMGANSPYAALNRRVEIILIEISSTIK